MRSVWPDLAAAVAVVVASLAIWGGSVIRQARQELVVEQPQN